MHQLQDQLAYARLPCSQPAGQRRCQAARGEEQRTGILDGGRKLERQRKLFGKHEIGTRIGQFAEGTSHTLHGIHADASGQRRAG